MFCFFFSWTSHSLPVKTNRSFSQFGIQQPNLCKSTTGPCSSIAAMVCLNPFAWLECMMFRISDIDQRNAWFEIIPLTIDPRAERDVKPLHHFPFFFDIFFFTFICNEQLLLLQDNDRSQTSSSTRKWISDILLPVGLWVVLVTMKFLFIIRNPVQGMFQTSCNAKCLCMVAMLTLTHVCHTTWHAQYLRARARN